MMKVFSFALVLCGVACLPYTQLKAQVIPEVGTHMSFNGGDFNIGFQGGIGIEKLDLSFRGDFTARAGAKRVLVESEQDPNLLYQYREARYYLGIEAEKRFKLLEFGTENTMGISGMLWGGYTFGDFHGTAEKPHRGFKYRPRVAPYLYVGDVALFRAGYEYLPLRAGGVSDHRAFVSITFTITSE